MKAKLLPKYTFQDVQRYWKQINAPVSLRHCPVSDAFSILLRPGFSPSAANAFILESADINELQRDVILRKLGAKSPVLDPKVVLADIRGKML